MQGLQDGLLAALQLQSCLDHSGCHLGSCTRRPLSSRSPRSPDGRSAHPSKLADAPPPLAYAQSPGPSCAALQRTGLAAEAPQSL
eukprot:9429522-Lingulodinium_polyedra.AAC.1